MKRVAITIDLIIILTFVLLMNFWLTEYKDILYLCMWLFMIYAFNNSTLKIISYFTKYKYLEFSTLESKRRMKIFFIVGGILFISALIVFILNPNNFNLTSTLVVSGILVFIIGKKEERTEVYITNNKIKINSDSFKIDEIETIKINHDSIVVETKEYKDIYDNLILSTTDIKKLTSFLKDKNVTSLNSGY